MSKNDARIAFLENLTRERIKLAEERRAQDDPLISIGDTADRLIAKCLCLDEARREREIKRAIERRSQERPRTSL